MRFTAASMTLLAVLVLLGGIGLGGVLALASRRMHATPISAQRVAAVPRAEKPVIEPAATQTVKAAVTPTVHPTATPAATRTPTASVAPTVTPTVTPAAVTAARDTWRFDEANASVGTIVWVGSAFRQGSEVIFDLHKESIAGHPAVPCERKTYLHLMLDPAHPSDTVPYHEVNCDGAGSDGIVRISQIASPESFTGSFWNGGTKLGDFVAHAQ